jgi:hypothetical protein
MEPLSAQEDPIQAAETRLSAPGPLGGLESEGSSRVSPPSERLRSVNLVVAATMRGSMAQSSVRWWECEVARAARNADYLRPVLLTVRWASRSSGAATR